MYRCSFCAFPNGYNDFKMSDLKRIERELNVFNRMGVREVAVLDPIFFKDADRGLKILELIERICPEIRFEIQSRVEHLTDEIMQKISELKIALEFGIQTLENEVAKIIKRVNKAGIIEKNLEKLNHLGVEFECHLIFGLPYQTEHSLEKDYRFLARYTSTVKLFPLVRLRGTALDIDINYGLHDDLVFSPIFPQEIISTRWMGSKTILKMKKEVRK